MNEPNPTDLQPVLSRLLDPIRDCLTKEVAAKIAALRADAKTQARLDELAEKNSAGLITPKERAEYEQMVNAVTLIAALQAKARSVVQGSASPSE